VGTVQAIFTQLGANSSIGIQFVLVCALFIIIKFLFLDKLQFVIENREEKTTKLDASADEIMEKAQALSAEYKEKVEAAYSEAQASASSAKDAFTKTQNESYANLQKELNNKVTAKRDDIVKDYNNKRTEVLAQSESMAKDLLEKIVQ